jgi:uncharacterized protein (DUF3820 family)
MATDRETVACSSCGNDHGFEARQAGPHVGLYCFACGAWHSWMKMSVQHDPDFLMPFGEHKGTPLKKIPTDYLIWGAEKFKGSMKERFQLALKQRFNDFGRCLFNICQGLAKNKNGTVSLAAAVRTFRDKHHIDPGRFFQYVTLYDHNKGDNAHNITINEKDGELLITAPPTE